MSLDRVNKLDELSNYLITSLGTGLWDCYPWVSRRFKMFSTPNFDLGSSSFIGFYLLGIDLNLV